MIGKCSIFGGFDDSGMTPSEGLAVWEHKEANKRHDLFQPQQSESQGVSKRLDPMALYFAYRYSKDIPRKKLQCTQWALRNPKTGAWVVASLVDWGPNVKTGRLFDVSPRVAQLLGVRTDDEIEGIALV